MISSIRNFDILIIVQNPLHDIIGFADINIKENIGAELDPCCIAVHSMCEIQDLFGNDIIHSRHNVSQ